MRYNMKQAISIVAALLAGVLLFAGCQATPEQPVVMQKDMEQMLEKAQDDESGTKVSELEATNQEHYTFSTSAADGRLTIEVDAPVIIPDVALPTVKVSEGSFTQEQVTGFFNYIFPNGGAYSYVSGEKVLTKAEIEDLILTYKQYIAEGTVSEHTLYTEEELQEEIAALEQQYAVAPETAQENPLSDGTMQRRMTTYGYVDANGEQAYREVAVNQVEATDGKMTFAVTVPVEPGTDCQAYLGVSRMGDGYIPVNFTETNAQKVSAKDASAAEGKLELSYSDAKALCDGFFAAGGITDVTLDCAYVIDDETRFGPDGQPHPAERYAYRFAYVRTVAGVPVANTAAVPSDDSPALPWGNESIQITIEDCGLTSIFWHSVTQPGEIITADTGVMSFQEVQDIFEKMILISYEGSEELVGRDDTTIHISVDEIALSLVRVREQNAGGRNGVYVPAWVFYGCEQQVNDTGVWYANSADKPAKYPLLAINAIDGSVIDLSKGY